jgi:type IX secretion system PorP/SprF family membrane protein
MFLSHEIDHNTGRLDIRNNFSDYNYFLTGGYEADLGPRMKLLPSMLIKYHPDHMIQIDYNVQISMIDRIYAGIGYRNGNTLVGMLQCQINHQLRMAYSYDFDFGSIGRYKNGSHEIGLNYIFRYERNVMGPRQY